MHGPLGIGRDVGHAVQRHLAVRCTGPQCVGVKFEVSTWVNAQASAMAKVEMAAVELEGGAGQHLKGAAGVHDQASRQRHDRTAFQRQFCRAVAAFRRCADVQGASCMDVHRGGTAVDPEGAM